MEQNVITAVLLPIALGVIMLGLGIVFVLLWCSAAAAAVAIGGLLAVLLLDRWLLTRKLRRALTGYSREG